MKKIIYIFILVFATFSHTKAHSSNWNNFRNINVIRSFDNFDNISSTLEYNRVSIIVNYSFVYQNWNNTTINNVKNELTTYIGLGYLNIFQIQYGISTTGNTKLRMKSSWMIKDFTQGIGSGSSDEWWEKFSIIFTFDKRYSEERVYNYGIGIGYTITTDFQTIFP